MAAYFIFELNVGYRVGDCLAFRKCDVMEKERPLHMKSQLTLVETKTRKTNKYRTVYFNKAITEVLAYLVKNKRDEDYLFIGHTGVLFEGEDGLYFVEKLAFQEPYQVCKFKNRTELSDYLMTKYDLSYDQPTAAPFIMENDQLMEGYRENPNK
jgi:hypothetical protein